MGGEWPKVQLGDVANLMTGYPFKSQHYTDDLDAPRLIGGDNIAQGNLRWDSVRRWPRDMTNGLDDYWLEPGDVVLAMDRPWIEAGLKRAAVGPHDVPSLLIQRTSRLRGTEELDTAFLRYVVGSQSFTQYILSVQTGTAVPHISPAQIRAYSFRLPPPTDQRAIAHILGTLDDKIELNRRRNQTLEAMARALFKDWFVDFGPVRAKMQLPSPSGRGAGGEGNNPQPRRKLPLPAAIRQHAAQLRRNATDAENLLWRLLRNQQLANAKFRRQHAVPPYILDFYCHELKLAVELDGGQHNEAAGRAHDARRTEYLHARGIEVLRFWNHDVLRETEAVLEAIYRAIEAKRDVEPSPPAPLPEGEGSTARFGTEGEESTARFVAKAKTTTTHHASTDALKPFSPREKGWDEGAYLPPDLWNLFPDRLDDEGKPEGWEMQSLANFIDIFDSRRVPLSGKQRAERPGPYPYYGAAGVLDSVDDFLFEGVHVLLGEDGSVVRADGRPYTQYVWGKFWVNNHAHVLRGRGISNEALLIFLDQCDVAPFVTGAVQPKLSQGNLKAIPFFYPGEVLLRRFGEIIDPLFAQIRDATEESRTLAQLRDTLLSKLISGELRIADAEKFMEHAASQSASQTGRVS